MTARFVLVLLLTLSGASGTVRAQTSGTAASAATALNPGDVLRITVWRKPELSGDFTIAGDGSISHPLYRDIQVTGVPMSTVDTRIRDYLAKLEANPQFVVEALLRVAVSGEVRQPNLYTLRPETSLSQAVALAGGVTERGRRDRLRLVRENHELIVDLRRPDVSGAGMLIHSGDQILVEQQRAVYRDVVGPIVGVLGATAAIVSVILYSGNHR